MKYLKVGLFIATCTGAGWLIGDSLDNRISEAIKAHNRTFISCMEQMEAGGEEVRFSIDACTVQTHYGDQ